jgi:hypothetical protein
MSNTSIKSVDFAQHGAIGAVLTDHQITEYLLRGNYGFARQTKAINDLANGAFPRLHKRVRAGEFGLLAQRSLSLYKRTTRKGNKTSPSSFLSDGQRADLIAMGLNPDTLFA